jgi:hypothetical protein
MRPQVVLAERVQPGLAAQAVEEVGGEAVAVARDAERDAPLAPAFLALGVLDHGGEVGAGILPHVLGHFLIEQRQAAAVLDGVAPERVVVQVDPRIVTETGRGYGTIMKHGRQLLSCRGPGHLRCRRSQSFQLPAMIPYQAPNFQSGRRKRRARRRH